ncbi:MAG: ABC transporter permease, partial [Mesorhizobium sp.]
MMDLLEFPAPARASFFPRVVSRLSRAVRGLPPSVVVGSLILLFW